MLQHCYLCNCCNLEIDLRPPSVGLSDPQIWLKSLCTKTCCYFQAGGWETLFLQRCWISNEHIDYNFTGFSCLLCLNCANWKPTCSPFSPKALTDHSPNVKECLLFRMAKSSETQTPQEERKREREREREREGYTRCHGHNSQTTTTTSLFNCRARLKSGVARNDSQICNSYTTWRTTRR